MIPDQLEASPMELDKLHCILILIKIRLIILTYMSGSKDQLTDLAACWWYGPSPVESN